MVPRLCLKQMNSKQLLGILPETGRTPASGCRDRQNDIDAVGNVVTGSAEPLDSLVVRLEEVV